MTGARTAHPAEILRAELLLTRGPPFTLWRILRRPTNYHFATSEREKCDLLKRELEVKSLRFWKTRDVDELKQLVGELIALDAQLCRYSIGVWIDGRLIEGKSP